jgi:hypothetical protein
MVYVSVGLSAVEAKSNPPTTRAATSRQIFTLGDIISFSSIPDR